LHEPILSPLPGERLCLHQRSDGLLQKERVAALDELLLERRQSDIVTEESIEQIPGAVCRERVQPHLRVAHLAAPVVLVLGAIGREQQQARRTQALHQPVEQRLRLAVDPMKVLEDQKEWLLSRFA